MDIETEKNCEALRIRNELPLKLQIVYNPYGDGNLTCGRTWPGVLLTVVHVGRFRYTHYTQDNNNNSSGRSATTPTAIATTTATTTFQRQLVRVRQQELSELS